MLVLSRKVGERVVIGGNVTVVVSKIAGNRVTLAIEAPAAMRIARTELPAAQQERLLARALEQRGECAAANVPTAAASTTPVPASLVPASPVPAAPVPTGAPSQPIAAQPSTRELSRDAAGSSPTQVSCASPRGPLGQRREMNRVGERNRVMMSYANMTSAAPAPLSGHRMAVGAVFGMAGSPECETEDGFSVLPSLDSNSSSNSNSNSGGSAMAVLPQSLATDFRLLGSANS